MPRSPKKYTIKVQRFRLRGDDPAPKLYTGTVAELTKIFSYTLECGYSWDGRVRRQPKSINALVNNLNRAAEASSRHYQSTYFTLVNQPA